MPDPNDTTPTEPLDPGAGDPTGPEPVEWAADLIRELALTGTGEAYLDIIRRAQVARFDDPLLRRLDESDPARHLTAAEALAVLEEDPEIGELTKAKARAIVETGRYVPAVAPVARPADRIPTPPRGQAHRARAPQPKPSAEGTDPGGEGAGPQTKPREVAAPPRPIAGPRQSGRAATPAVAPKPAGGPRNAAPPAGPKNAAPAANAGGAVKDLIPAAGPKAAVQTIGAAKDLAPKSDDAPSG